MNIVGTIKNILYGISLFLIGFASMWLYAAYREPTEDGSKFINQFKEDITNAAILLALSLVLIIIIDFISVLKKNREKQKLNVSRLYKL